MPASASAALASAAPAESEVGPKRAPPPEQLPSTVVCRVYCGFEAPCSRWNAAFELTETSGVPATGSIQANSSEGP